MWLKWGVGTQDVLNTLYLVVILIQSLRVGSRIFDDSFNSIIINAASYGPALYRGQVFFHVVSTDEKKTSANPHLNRAVSKS